MDAGTWAALRERAVAERGRIEGELRRRDLAPRRRERLELVKGVALGQALPTIATWSGRSVVRSRYWLGRYAADGIAALSDAPRSGRPPKADAVYVAALEAALARAPREQALLFAAWTSARLSAYLA